MKRNADINPTLRPPGEDRRQWVRYPVRMNSLCRAADVENGSTWPAQIQNVSHDGIKLLCLRPLEVGRQILVSPSDGKIVPKVVRVVRVSNGSDGNWIVGCVFARELLDEAELLTWVKGQNGHKAG